LDATEVPGKSVASLHVVRYSQRSPLHALLDTASQTLPTRVNEFD
jgi:hypothetical protein